MDFLCDNLSALMPALVLTVVVVTSCSQEHLRSFDMASLAAINLGAISSSGVTLALPHSTGMQSSLPLLKKNYKFSKVCFWGKLMGITGDYLIAMGIEESYTKAKFFYWCVSALVSHSAAALCPSASRCARTFHTWLWRLSKPAQFSLGRLFLTWSRIFCCSQPGRRLLGAVACGHRGNAGRLWQNRIGQAALG